MMLRVRVVARPVVLLLSLLAAPRESRAQLADSARIAIGARVWVRMRDGAEGAWRFERTSADSFTLRRRVGDSDELLAVPWSEAARVDTMVIAPPSARRTLIGSAVGGLLGSAVVYIGATQTSCHAELSCPSVGFAILAPEIVGTGVLIGAAVGYLHRDWHWSTAWRAPAPP